VRPAGVSGLFLRLCLSDVLLRLKKQGAAAPYLDQIDNRNEKFIILHDNRINIVDECNTAEACLIVDTGDKLEAQTQQMPYDPNKLHEMSLIAMYGFFVRKGIIDSETRIRVASWSVRPHEIDSFVDERLVGSMAHTANQIFLGK
jgi:hypothetical protein